jgi:phosphatidylserine decarboxylase
MPAFFLLGLALSLITALPLAGKWALGIGRTIVVITALSVLAAVSIAVTPVWQSADDPLLKAGATWLATISAAFGLLAYRFYRDPERTIPAATNVIVSPADGEVLYVRMSRDGTLPISTKNGRPYTLRELTKTPLEMRAAAVIGIGMTFLDVHVNRAPIAGRVTKTEHFPGLFGSLRRADMAFENARRTTIIQDGDLQVAVVQIASRLVRQIVSFVREDEQVALGQRIGMIRFGSQVDVVLPCRTDLDVRVTPGDRVIAGESIVAIVTGADSRPRS